MSPPPRGRVLGIAHLGVAVRDPRERLALWAEGLGLPLEGAEAVPSEGVRTWMLDCSGSKIELLEALGDASPVAKHLAKRGEGLHHVCLAVDDLDAVLARLASRGIRPLGEGVRDGAGGAKVAFLHPRDGGGVLIELSQGPEHGATSTTTASAVHPFAAGTVVVAYLKEPRERIVGVIRGLDGAGISLAGIDLESWDDFLSQWARDTEPAIVSSTFFFPAARLEKLLADADQGEVPSLARTFAERTGRSLVLTLTDRVENPR